MCHLPFELVSMVRLAHLKCSFKPKLGAEIGWCPNLNVALALGQNLPT